MREEEAQDRPAEPNVWIPMERPFYGRFTELCEAQGITKDEALERAIRGYLERHRRD